MTATEVKIPEYARCTPEATIVGDHIVFVTIDYDISPENPCKAWDGFGEIRSLSNRHINRIDRDEAKELLESDEDVVALSYFEHGNSLWMVMNSPTPAGVEFRWDGVRFAGVWIPDKCVRESYTGQDGLPRRDWMVEQAKSACETYTQWVNGEVYGYNVEIYKLRKDDDGEPYDLESDYRRENTIFEDSCWGFYGWEHVEQEVKDVIASAVKGLE